jgi:hypothetical protein
VNGSVKRARNRTGWQRRVQVKGRRERTGPAHRGDTIQLEHPSKSTQRKSRIFRQGSQRNFISFRGRGHLGELLVRIAREIGSSASQVDVRLGKPGERSVREIPRSVEGEDADIPTLKQAEAEAAKFH